MQLRNCGRPELIINRAAQQKRNTPENGRQGKPRNTSCFRVARRAVFDIHGNVICQPRAHDCLQLLRKRAVCVQLDRIAQCLDLFQQSGKLRAQKRLSAGNGNTVEKPLPFFKNANSSSSSMPSSSAAVSSGALWQNGQRKLQPDKTPYRPSALDNPAASAFEVPEFASMDPSSCFLYMNGAIACRYICSTNRITLCWSNRSYPSNTTLRSPFDRQR